MNWVAGRVYRSRIHGGLITAIKFVLNSERVSPVLGEKEYITHYKCLSHDRNTIVNIDVSDFNMDWQYTEEINKTIKLLFGEK